MEYTDRTVQVVIWNQRYQELESRLQWSDTKLCEAESRAVAREKELEGMQSEIERLKRVLAESESEKIRLRMDKADLLSETAASRRLNEINSSISSEIQRLKDALHNALAVQRVDNEDKSEMQKTIDESKAAIEKKQSEIAKLQEELNESRNREVDLKEKLARIDPEVKQMKAESREMMQQWFSKENEWSHKTAELNSEISYLKIKLEKKAAEHDKTKHILQITKDALKDCLVYAKAQERGNSVPQMSNLAGSSLSIREEGTSTGHAVFADYEVAVFERTSNAVMEPLDTLYGLSFEELRIKAKDLVRRVLLYLRGTVPKVDKLNNVIRCSCLDESKGKALANERNKAICLNSVLKSEVSSRTSLIEKLKTQVRTLEEENRDLNQKLSEAEEERAECEINLEAVKATNDEYAAKIKFLMKKNEVYEKMQIDNSTNQPRGLPLPSGKLSGLRYGENIHGIVEENRLLRIENHQLKARQDQQGSNVPSPDEEESEMSHEIVPESETPVEGESSKRVCIAQAGPSRKKIRTQEPEDDSTCDWKDKWERAMNSLNSSDNKCIQIETELRQQTEKLQSQNASYVRELKILEGSLMDYKIKHESLSQIFENQKENFELQLKERSSRIAQLDQVVKSLSKEVDNLKAEISEYEASRTADRYKLEQAQRSFRDLQERAIAAEQAHQEEIAKIKDSIQAQIQESLNAYHSPEGEYEAAAEMPFDADRQSESIAELYEQIRQKDAAIAELAKRLEDTEEASIREKMYDLQTQYDGCVAEIRVLKEENERLKKYIMHHDEEHKANLKAVTDVQDRIVNEKDQIKATAEAARDAAILEIDHIRRLYEQSMEKEMELQEELASVKNQMEAAKSAADAASAELESVREKMSSMNEQKGSKIDSLQTRTDQLEYENQELVRNLDDERARSESLRQEIERLKEAAEAGDQSKSKGDGHLHLDIVSTGSIEESPFRSPEAQKSDSVRANAALSPRSLPSVPDKSNLSASTEPLLPTSKTSPPHGQSEKPAVLGLSERPRVLGSSTLKKPASETGTSGLKKAATDANPDLKLNSLLLQARNKMHTPQNSTPSQQGLEQRESGTQGEDDGKRKWRYITYTPKNPKKEGDQDKKNQKH